MEFAAGDKSTHPGAEAKRQHSLVCGVQAVRQLAHFVLSQRQLHAQPHTSDRELCIEDVSYIHHNRVDLRVRAGESAGAAAALRDRENRGHYGRIDSDGYKFGPISVETHGRLGTPAMTLLHTLAHAAEHHSNGFVSAASFTLRVLQELACVNVEWNARIETTVAGIFSLVAGQAFMSGDPRPPVWEDD